MFRPVADTGKDVSTRRGAPYPAAMCASYEAVLNVSTLVRAFVEAKIFPRPDAPLPNWPSTDEVRPTDAGLALRMGEDGAADLSKMRFGFPAPAPKRPPVINFRSEGREFRNGPAGGRALIPVSGFYEFTGDKYPKTRWVLRAADQPFLALAAVWRGGPEGDAFALLTADPGPDVAPFHDRGVLPLPPALWADWLGGTTPAQDLLKPPPAGTLTAEQKLRDKAGSLL